MIFSLAGVAIANFCAAEMIFSAFALKACRSDWPPVFSSRIAVPASCTRFHAPSWRTSKSKKSPVVVSWMFRISSAAAMKAPLFLWERKRSMTQTKNRPYQKCHPRLWRWPRPNRKSRGVSRADKTPRRPPRIDRSTQAWRTGSASSGCALVPRPKNPGRAWSLRLTLPMAEADTGVAYEVAAIRALDGAFRTKMAAPSAATSGSTATLCATSKPYSPSATPNWSSPRTPILSPRCS